MDRRRASQWVLWNAVVPGLLGAESIVLPAWPQPLRANAARTAVHWPLGCRLACYGKFQDAGWTHLPSIGVRYVFVSVPQAALMASLQKRLDEHHLKPLVMRGEANLAQPNSALELAVQLATCEKMGVRYLFLSPQHPGVGKEVAYERLRRAGEVARRHGVTISLETHPDLGTNGDVHRETMRRINLGPFP